MSVIFEQRFVDCCGEGQGRGGRSERGQLWSTVYLRRDPRFKHLVQFADRHLQPRTSPSTLNPALENLYSVKWNGFHNIILSHPIMIFLGLFFITNLNISKGIIDASARFQTLLINIQYKVDY